MKTAHPFRPAGRRTAVRLVRSGNDQRRRYRGATRSAQAIGLMSAAGGEDDFGRFDHCSDLAAFGQIAIIGAEARGSLSSLTDLIRRATKLASNLDHGRTASRADLASAGAGADFMDPGK